MLTGRGDTSWPDADPDGAVLLNLLREADLDVSPDAGFDRRLMRRLRAQRAKEGLRYWTPALVGALVAMAVVFGVLARFQPSPEARSGPAVGTAEHRAQDPLGPVPLSREFTLRP